MSDEIKEIIEYISSRTVDDILLEDYFKELEDYITNLQERIAYLERSNNRMEDTILGQRQELADLEQENERLLKQLEDISLDEANIRADVLLEQQDYKLRIEKATKLLKRYGNGTFD